MKEIENLENDLKKVENEINDFFEKFDLFNKKVSNKMYGVGKISKFINQIIEVEFENGYTAKFEFPTAFVKGFLKFENKMDFDELNIIVELEDRKNQIIEKINFYKEELENVKIDKKKIVENEIYMMAVLTNKSFDDCVHYNIYCCKANVNYSKDIQYLALYKDKCINAIGKVKKIVKAIYIDNQWRTSLYYGKEAVTDEDVKQIENLRTRGLDLFNCDIGDMEHYYFIIEEFVLSNFVKTTSFALQKIKYFNLCEILERDVMPDIKELVLLINKKEW